MYRADLHLSRLALDTTVNVYIYNTNLLFTHIMSGPNDKQSSYSNAYNPVHRTL